MQVQTKGHKQHLEHCTARKRPRRDSENVGEDDEEKDEEEEDEEELAQINASKVPSLDCLLALCGTSASSLQLLVGSMLRSPECCG